MGQKQSCLKLLCVEAALPLSLLIITDRDYALGLHLLYAFHGEQTDLAMPIPPR
ncbi:hypothetical protein [Desulfitobacterium hafniense]|uniref:Uncharacterized protein n=1 Tax=Desulfitobacterium hafniense DP7 TaxID=537010 RepID=G9XI93_DESHA|nr:hypothetical protein [Desulfitobacterium hafniense]EHL08576.1 hypothetical protein HMPREF0322_00669 [Desulfitobacterium hafniense DP7]